MNKGVIFSILSVFLMVPVVFLMISLPQLDNAGRMADMSRITFDQMHFFGKNVEYDLGKIMFIAGKRAMVSLTNNVIISGVPVPDSALVLEELVENGTYLGLPEPLMDGNNMGHWSSEMESSAGSIGFNLSFKDVNVSVIQHSFSEISFRFSGVMDLKDFLGRHTLQKIIGYGLNISVSGFEDPVYPLNTFGRVKRIFKVCSQDPAAVRLLNATLSSGSAFGETVVRLSSQSFDNITDRGSKILLTDNASAAPSNDFRGVVAEMESIDGVIVPYLAGAENALGISPDQHLYMDGQSKSLWDLRGFQEMVDSGCYHYSGGGPSFLARAEGKFSGGSAGLVSFVDLVELSSNDVPLKPGETVADYRYFDDESFPGYRVRGVGQTWFRLDNETALDFGVFALLDH